VEISGLEANFLLFALDKFVQSDHQGRVTMQRIEGYNLTQIQMLRDKLFAAHVHPQETED